MIQRYILCGIHEIGKEEEGEGKRERERERERERITLSLRFMSDFNAILKKILDIVPNEPAHD